MAGLEHAGCEARPFHQLFWALEIGDIHDFSEENGFEGQEVPEIPSNMVKRRTFAKQMSIEEAASQLDLSKQDILVFINSDSVQVNVLYRRKDGEMEWVEPHPK